MREHELVAVFFCFGAMVAMVAVTAWPPAGCTQAGCTQAVAYRESRLNQCRTELAEIKAGIAYEEGLENSELFPELSDRDYVRMLYRAVLGRGGDSAVDDPNGQKNWEDWLDRGATRAWVAWHFMTGEEFRSRVESLARPK